MYLLGGPKYTIAVALQPSYLNFENVGLFFIKFSSIVRSTLVNYVISSL